MVCQYHTRKDKIVRQRHAHKRDAAEWLAGGGLEGSNQGLCDAGMMLPGSRVGKHDDARLAGMVIGGWENTCTCIVGLLSPMTPHSHA